MVTKGKPLELPPDQPCGARTRNGTPCKRFPPPGGTRCKLHGGYTPSALAKAQRRLANAEVLAEVEQLRQLGLVQYGEDQNPVVVLAEQMREAHVNVQVLRKLVGDLGMDLTTVDDDHRPHVRAQVELYGQERDRLARLAEVAVKLNLADRQVRLNELVVKRLADALELGVTEAGLTGDQAELLRKAVARALRPMA